MQKLVAATMLALGFASAAGAQMLSSPLRLPPLGLRATAAPSAWNLGRLRGISGDTFPMAGPSIHFTAEDIASGPQDAGKDPETTTRFPWQLGLSYEYVRFRSSAIDASLNGLHTTLIYFIDDSIGVEASAVAAFGLPIFGDERPKYLLYTGGPRIVWARKRWQPWGHALVGGVHMLPQIAGGFGHNSFAAQVGGGADYRVSPMFLFRLEGDYVRTQLYSAGQNNFQFGAGVAFQF